MGNTSNSLAMRRINKLVDENSFLEVGAQITARNTDFNLNVQKQASDGVICGYGLINENLVFIYSQDVTVLNGTIGEMHAKKIAGIYDMAVKMGAPVIGLIDCGGIRLQESLDALDGLGAIYMKQSHASGVIPQISAVFGNCGGGLTTVAALCDFCFIEKDKGRMFVNPPNAIQGNKVEACDTAAPEYQAKETGMIDLVSSEDEILYSIRELIGFLPGNNGTGGEVIECVDDLNRLTPNVELQKEDPRLVLRDISDCNVFFETKRDYAQCMVTGFIKMNGITVGAVANATAFYDEEGIKSKEFDAVLSTRGCKKASEFIDFCNAFDIPLLTLSNVTGYKATMCSEHTIGKSMAKLTYAFANADIPKVTLIMGEAFGSAYVTMNSKSIGADIVYAWPNARIGMMDAVIAAKIMYPDANSEEIERVTKEYEELQSSVISAAKHGHVDKIIDTAQTRKYLLAAFELLYTKSTGNIGKKHGTK
ncbi:MAG: acyl-CoA carboxylase subunit beta [Lachnospiraceae bacterium]